MIVSGISASGHISTRPDIHAMTGSYAAPAGTLSQLTSYPQIIGSYAQLAARADAVSFTGNSLRTTIEQFQRTLSASGGQVPTLDRMQTDLLQEQAGILVTQYNRMVTTARTVKANGLNDAFSESAPANLAATGITRAANTTLAFNHNVFAAAINPDTAAAESAGMLSALGDFAAGAGRTAATVINEVQDLTAAATVRISGLLQTAAREQLNQLAQSSLISFATINNSITNNLSGAAGNETYSNALPPNRWALNNLGNFAITNDALAGSLFGFLADGNRFNSVQHNQLMFNSLTALNNAAIRILPGASGPGTLSISQPEPVTIQQV